MPNLEFLDLRNSLPSDPPDASVQPVHIARLRQLRFTSTRGSSQISNFLALITVPNIFIFCIARLGRGYTALESMSAFTSSLDSLIRGMHLEVDGRHYKSVWVYATSDGLSILASRMELETDWPFIMEFELTMKCGDSPEDTLRKILPALPRDKLEIGLCNETLLELSDTLPSLRNILLREGMPNFIAVLTMEKQLPLFPNLRCLCLYRATFTSRIIDWKLVNWNGPIEVRCHTGENQTF